MVGIADFRYFVYVLWICGNYYLDAYNQISYVKVNNEVFYTNGVESGVLSGKIQATGGAAR